MKPNEESNSFINNYIKASSSNNNLNLIFNINQKKIQHCKKNGQICYGFITNATSLKKLYTSILTLILILFVLCGQFYITQSLRMFIFSKFKLIFIIYDLFFFLVKKFYNKINFDFKKLKLDKKKTILEK